MSKLQHQREQLLLETNQKKQDRIDNQHKAELTAQMAIQRSIQNQIYNLQMEKTAKKMEMMTKQKAEKQMKKQMEEKIRHDEYVEQHKKRMIEEQMERYQKALIAKKEKDEKDEREKQERRIQKELEEEQKKIEETIKKEQWEQARKAAQLLAKQKAEKKALDDNNEELIKKAVKEYHTVQTQILKWQNEETQLKLKKEKLERENQFKQHYAEEENQLTHLFNQSKIHQQKLKAQLDETIATIKPEYENQQRIKQNQEKENEMEQLTYQETQLRELQMNMDNETTQFILGIEERKNQMTIKHQNYKLMQEEMEISYKTNQETQKILQHDIQESRQHELDRQLLVKKQIEDLQCQELELQKVIQHQLVQKQTDIIQLKTTIQKLDSDSRSLILKQKEEDVKFEQDEHIIKTKQNQKIKQDERQFRIHLEYEKTNLIAQHKENIQLLEQKQQTVLKQIHNRATQLDNEHRKIQKQIFTDNLENQTKLKTMHGEFYDRENQYQENLERRLQRDAAYKLYFAKSQEEKDITLIRTIKTNQITTVINVYQETYQSQSKKIEKRQNASGFGDFLRGSYFLMQLCDMIQCEYEILIVHPLSQYLKRNNRQNYIVNHNLPKFHDIVAFDKNNFITNIDSQTKEIKYIGTDNISSDFLQYIVDSIPQVQEQQEEKQEPILCYTIAYPMNPVIPEKHKRFMRGIFNPTDEMNEYLNETLKPLELVKNQYKVIHIRCGDKYLFTPEEKTVQQKENLDKKEKEKEREEKIYQNILAKLEEDLLELDQHQAQKQNQDQYKYLLISDNNQIKPRLIKEQEQERNIQTLMNEITHLGEGVELDNEKVKNTLLDLYLISNANQILSYSVYEHGTGFSKWLAETYNIPYTCKYIDDK